MVGGYLQKFLQRLGDHRCIRWSVCQSVIQKLEEVEKMRVFVADGNKIGIVCAGVAAACGHRVPAFKSSSCEGGWWAR